MFPGNNFSELLRSEKNPSFSFVVKSCGSQNLSRVRTETKDLKIGITSYFLVFAQTVPHFKYSKRQNKQFKNKKIKKSYTFNFKANPRVALISADPSWLFDDI